MKRSNKVIDRDFIWVVSCFAIVSALGSAAVLAQQPPPFGTVPMTYTPAPPLLDMTQIIVALVGGLFTCLTAYIGYIINAKVKDQAARNVLSTAVNTSLGAMQNAIQAGVQAHPLQVQIPGLTAPMAASVQYVLDHADKEIEWLNDQGYDITPQKIAEKIAARTGLTPTIQSVTASGTPVPPILPVGVAARG